MNRMCCGKCGYWLFIMDKEGFTVCVKCKTKYEFQDGQYIEKIEVTT